MNPLEKHPHLFANGKFKVKPKTSHVGKYTGSLADSIRLGYSDPDSYTLIARPISDMTDEELYEAHQISDSYGDVNDFDIEQWREVLTQWVELDEIKFATARYLLSIQVLPFSQTLFENGTVINATEKQPV